MIELCYMIIDEMGTDKDEAGAVMSATAHCEHEENTQCVLHLPPSLRPNQGWNRESLFYLSIKGC